MCVCLCMCMCICVCVCIYIQGKETLWVKKIREKRIIYVMHCRMKNENQICNENYIDQIMYVIEDTIKKWKQFYWKKKNVCMYMCV